MGLLRAATGAMRSVLNEQWREFFICDAIGSDWLLVRGRKQIGKNSANTRKDDNVLSNGSILSVADGQCVLVVKQGKVIDVCSEPGEHVFEDAAQRGVSGFFREVGRRVAFGGGDIQPTVYRVYYLNVRELTGIRFRTPNPILMRVSDSVTGMDLDSAVSTGGCYSCRVSDPVRLYKTVIGNVGGDFARKELEAHMNAELMKAFQPAIAACTAAGVRPSALPAHIPMLCDALREKLDGGWFGAHGLSLVSLAIEGFRVEDQARVTAAQHAACLRDPELASATLTQATAAAMTAATKGTGMAAILAAAATPSAHAAQYSAQPPRTKWKCACGAISDRNFCPECGRKRPQ